MLELLPACNTRTKPGRKARRESRTQAQSQHAGSYRHALRNQAVSALTLTHQQFRVIREESWRVSRAQDGRGVLGLAAKTATDFLKCFVMN